MSVLVCSNDWLNCCLSVCCYYRSTDSRIDSRNSYQKYLNSVHIFFHSVKKFRTIAGKLICLMLEFKLVLYSDTAKICMVEHVILYDIHRMFHYTIMSVFVVSSNMVAKKTKTLLLEILGEYHIWWYDIPVRFKSRCVYQYSREFSIWCIHKPTNKFLFSTIDLDTETNKMLYNYLCMFKAKYSVPPMVRFIIPSNKRSPQTAHHSSILGAFECFISSQHVMQPWNIWLVNRQFPAELM